MKSKIDSEKILSNSKTSWLLVLAIFITTLAYFGLTSIKQIPEQTKQLTYETRAVNIDGRTLNLIVSDTHEKRVLGLSGRSSLDGADGMLFVFDSPDLHGIWMKDMIMTIDIFWYDDRWNKVHEILSASPESYPEVFKPETPAFYVVEIPTKKLP